ncbi:MAG: hypothetical protein GEU90_19835 [Gemmatimonas sp.]|nr:hypothetical protein [Gemmatimonas sp.]
MWADCLPSDSGHGAWVHPYSCPNRSRPPRHQGARGTRRNTCSASSLAVDAEAREVEEQAAVPVPPTGRELLRRWAQLRDRPFRSTRRRIPRWARQFGAASLAVGAFTSLVLSAIRPSADSVGSVPFEFGTGGVVTGAGEAVTVKLGDGTIVRLAPESRLRMMGQTGRREVWMDSRAFFAVTKVEDRPFVVRTHAPNPFWRNAGAWNFRPGAGAPSAQTGERLVYQSQDPLENRSLPRGQ